MKCLTMKLHFSNCFELVSWLNNLSLKVINQVDNRAHKMLNRSLRHLGPLQEAREEKKKRKEEKDKKKKTR